MFFHPRANGFAKRFDIVAGSTAGVDQEIAVYFRNLRAAQPQTPATCGVDQLPGALARRVLECRTSGFLAYRLRGFAMALHLVHPRPNRLRRGDLPAKACRGENDRSVGAAVSVNEFHVRVLKDMFFAVATDADSLDQDVLGLRAISAGIHAQRTANAARNAEEKFQAAQAAGRRGFGDAPVERGGPGADDLGFRLGFAKAART